RHLHLLCGPNRGFGRSVAVGRALWSIVAAHQSQLQGRVVDEPGRAHHALSGSRVANVTATEMALGVSRQPLEIGIHNVKGKDTLGREVATHCGKEGLHVRAKIQMHERVEWADDE